MARSRPTLAALLLMFSQQLVSQSPGTLGTGLPPGPDAVGHRREWVVDPSRLWTGGSHLGDTVGPIGRPLRVEVWYPATRSANCRPMTIGDFVQSQPADPYFAAANRLLQAWDQSSYEGFATGAQTPVASFYALRTNACSNAPIRTGRHPLVVYSGGWYNRTPDNIAMAEYLASHGYVVAEVALFGEGLSTGDLSSNPIAVETQLRDVETVLGSLIQEPWIDRNKVAAMGYSTGGIVALLLQSRNPLIDATIGLDPSYGGESAFIFSSRDFHMNRNRGPLLTLRCGNDACTRRQRDAVLDSMHLADRYTADVGRGGHGDFSDDVVIEGALGLVRPGEPRSTREGLEAYRGVVLAVHRFLDQVLRRQSGSLDAVLATPTGAVLRMKKTLGAAIPSSAEWIELVLRGGFATTVARAKELAAAHPGVLIVSERDINTAGYRQLNVGNPTLAVLLMRFNQETHASSANSYDSLADACIAAADRSCQVEAYRGLLRTLAADPAIPAEAKEQMRANAEARLKALEG